MKGIKIHSQVTLKNIKRHHMSVKKFLLKILNMNLKRSKHIMSWKRNLNCLLIKVMQFLMKIMIPLHWNQSMKKGLSDWARCKCWMSLSDMVAGWASHGQMWVLGLSDWVRCECRACLSDMVVDVFLPCSDVSAGKAFLIGSDISVEEDLLGV